MRKQLKGENGYRIYIEDASGREKEELAARPVVHGQDVRLTIDADLQRMLYEQFREDKGCSVAMNPCTGEVLALVSTPSYDDNAFILGLSDAQWSAWNGDEARPLYNAFARHGVRDPPLSLSRQPSGCRPEPSIPQGLRQRGASLAEGTVPGALTM